MKKKVFYAIILVSLFSVFTSCKKDDPKASAKGTVNGAPWTASAVSAKFVYGHLTITAVGITGDVVTLKVEPLTGLETMMPYDLNFGDISQFGSYQQSSTSSIFTTSADLANDGLNSSVSLSKFDASKKEVSGTYTMQVKDPNSSATMTLTGTFTDVVYDTTVPPIPTKTMTATIGTTNFVATSITSLDVLFNITTICTAANGNKVSIIVPDDITPGTYTVSEDGDYRVTYSVGSNISEATTGQIVITENDPDAAVLTGTFTASAPSTGYYQPFIFTLTAGTFVTTY